MLLAILKQNISDTELYKLAQNYPFECIVKKCCCLCHVFKFYLRLDLPLDFLLGLEEPTTVLFTVLDVSETKPDATRTVPDTVFLAVRTTPFVRASPLFTIVSVVRTTGRTRLLARLGKLNFSFLSDIYNYT